MASLTNTSDVINSTANSNGEGAESGGQSPQDGERSPRRALSASSDTSDSHRPTMYSRDSTGDLAAVATETLGLEKLRVSGNEAVAHGRNTEAEKLYGIAIEESIRSGEEGGYSLYGNRSLVRLRLGKYELALQDAESAIVADPSYVKGYHRKGSALRKLGRLREALEVYTDDVPAKEHGSAWLIKEIAIVKSEIVAASRVHPCNTLDEWILTFTCLPDPRQRLHCLAIFWNASTEQERHDIFSKFLERISVVSTDTAHTGIKASDFPTSSMIPLPIDNYTDLVPEEAWLKFWGRQSSSARVETCEQMWLVISPEERDIIIEDMRHFFLEPLLVDRGVITPKRADEEPEAS